MSPSRPARKAEPAALTRHRTRVSIRVVDRQLDGLLQIGETVEVAARDIRASPR